MKRFVLNLDDDHLKKMLNASHIYKKKKATNFLNVFTSRNPKLRQWVSSLLIGQVFVLNARQYTAQ